ncbi:MAG: hypothetical protein ABI672_20380 [Vicinamibacteria bacterium]
MWGAAFAWRDVIPVNDGLGWDGVRFAKMVERGPEMLPMREINSYYVQRVGPSLAVRALLQATGQPLDTASIRYGFIFLNLTLLSLAMLLMMDAAALLSLNNAGRWILFIGLFLTPANGRLPIYYAPIGDSTAFFLGALIVWGYVTRRPIAMVVAFVLAIVCWPAAFLLLPLLVWPRAMGETRHELDIKPLPLSLRIAVIVLAIPVGWLLLMALTKAVAMPPVEVWTTQLKIAVGSNALVLGCAAGFALVVAALNVRRATSKPSMAGVMAAVALIAASVLYVRRFESGSLAFGGDTFAREMLLFVRSGPFASLVGHTAYYSALAVLAMALWPEVLRSALRLGPGAFLGTALSGLIALDAESRRLNAYWPLVALVTVLAAQAAWLRGRQPMILAGACLILSKLWWPMTGPNLFPAAHDPGNYFNTQGPSMSNEAILANGLMALVLSVWIWKTADTRTE